MYTHYLHSVLVVEYVVVRASCIMLISEKTTNYFPLQRLGKEDIEFLVFLLLSYITGIYS